MGLAGLCPRPFGEGCTAQNAGDRCVPPPRRSTPGSPSSSRLALASLPQLDLEVRSLRNAARQYPCARPPVLSPRAPMTATRARPLIAFFDYPDVFEDFYPHYGVDQQAFATRWSATGSHAFISLMQSGVGDVVWYCFSLRPEISEARHETLGFRVRFLRSGWLHRSLWRLFYLPRMAWRWRGAYRGYATVASYLALLSWPLVRALRRDRPDCLFVQSYSSGRFDVLLLAARLLGVPLIAYHAGGGPEGYLGRFLRHWTLAHADCLIASGRSEAEMLAS